MHVCTFRTWLYGVIQILYLILWAFLCPNAFPSSSFLFPLLFHPYVCYFNDAVGYILYSDDGGMTVNDDLENRGCFFSCLTDNRRTNNLPDIPPALHRTPHVDELS
jgi:hypothetical protein